MKTKIYVLSELDGPVRYVGKTVQTLARRLQAHKDEARRGTRNHRCNWLRSIRYAVSVSLLFEVDGDGSVEEISLIKEYRDTGYSLVNGTPGGDGRSGYVTPLEVREKISRALTGHRVTRETRKKISKGHRGKLQKPPSVETRKKLSLARLGHLVSAETRRKLSRANNATTPKDVERIKHLSSQGWSQRRIASLLGISQPTVWNKLHGLLLPIAA
jgi:DNA-directed RNA polymerase specialized sigma24 family protein